MFFKKEKIIKEHERNELRLIDEIAGLNEYNNELYNRLTETTNQVIKTTNQLIDVKKELETTKELCENKNRRIADLEEKNRKLASSNGGLKSNYTRLKTKVEALEKENRELKYRAKPYKAKDLELYNLTGRKFDNGQKVK